MGQSWQQLLILLLVVVVIFGTKKLRNIGSDLGGAVKDFKKAMNDDQPKDAEFKKNFRRGRANFSRNSKQKEQA